MEVQNFVAGMSSLVPVLVGDEGTVLFQESLGLAGSVFLARIYYYWCRKTEFMEGSNLVFHECHHSVLTLA